MAKFRDDSRRLCEIITGAETWIYHWQIAHKSTNASWFTEGESPTTVTGRGRFQPKTLFSIFLKSNDLVLIHVVDKNTTADHNYYIENCLKAVVKKIRKQSKSSGTKRIKLLHDSARPYTHSDVINYLFKESIIIMQHPPYSPDLAPCDH